MWHLLTAHQQESFLPFSSRQCLSCFLSLMAKGSNPKSCGPNSLSSLVVLTLCQSCVVPTSLKPYGPQKRCVIPKRDAEWLPCLGINLSLQPNFQLLPQFSTAASIPGRFGPAVWSQLSPSSAGPHYKSLFGAPLLSAPYYSTTSRNSGNVSNDYWQAVCLGSR